MTCASCNVFENANLVQRHPVIMRLHMSTLPGGDGTAIAGVLDTIPILLCTLANGYIHVSNVIRLEKAKIIIIMATPYLSWHIVLLVQGTSGHNIYQYQPYTTL